MQSYNFKDCEKSAHCYWEKYQCFKVSNNKKSLTSTKKVYCLSMFPYTSGNLHIGHVRNYTIGDIISRINISSGKVVLHPMGWDSFGLPAENASKKHGVDPQKWTSDNATKMRQQMKAMGFSFDWSREISTCDPHYYKHEQWLFIQMFNRGLVYQKEALVYWDPVDQTILANEQVIDGCGWRSGAPVEKRWFNQWFVRVTDYADTLYNNLETKVNWPKPLVQAQKDWIGCSQGYLITYPILNHDQFKSVEIFTTSLSSCPNINAILLATNHPITLELAQHNIAIKNFIEQESIISVKHLEEFVGIDTNLKSRNLITNQIISIWISNFVLADYGTGAVQSSPSEDKRDGAFTNKYKLPIVNSDIKYSPTEIMSIIGKLGKKHTCYRLRDWSIGRNRYWGTPIPMINCSNCGPVPVNLADLPITHLTPKNLYCPQCNCLGPRDNHTFDTFFDSSWYFVRFICPQLLTKICNDDVKLWLPVDYYIGGMEHATMHFLYARVIYLIMHDLGLVPSGEPFKNVINQGMVLKDGHKMSKSKGNIVDLTEILTTYGADALRFFIVVAAPITKEFNWDDSSLKASFKFLTKFYDFAISLKNDNYVENNMSPSLIHIINETISDFEALKFNTAASGCIKIFNNLKKEPNLLGLSYLLRLLAPIVPHIAHKLWIELGYGPNILDASFPQHISLKVNDVKLIYQINGKTKGVVMGSVAQSQEYWLHLLNDKGFYVPINFKRIIYIQDKVINFVIDE